MTLEISEKGHDFIIILKRESVVAVNR